jgi:hypothetical protein
VGGVGVMAPFLITSVDSVQTPILGFNAICKLAEDGQWDKITAAFSPQQRQKQVEVLRIAVSHQQETKAGKEQWDPAVDLDKAPLTEEQKRRVRQVLREECNAFSRDDDDVGTVEELQMNISLKDDSPVQRAYVSIPPLMYEEVKAYMDDLRRRQWIRPSKSSYSSPMVCVRKRYGSLRLCIDYRQLNNKTWKDSQPIPRIQDTLNALGGKKWFSTLEEGISSGLHDGGVAAPDGVRHALGTTSGYASRSA